MSLTFQKGRYAVSCRLGSFVRIAEQLNQTINIKNELVLYAVNIVVSLFIVPRYAGHSFEGSRLRDASAWLPLANHWFIFVSLSIATLSTQLRVAICGPSPWRFRNLGWSCMPVVFWMVYCCLHHLSCTATKVITPVCLPLYLSVSMVN